MTADSALVAKLARRRWRAAITCLIPPVGLYIIFIALVAFDKELAGTVLMPGLSVIVALGMFTMLVSWLSTIVYVKWAERQNWKQELEGGR